MIENMHHKGTYIIKSNNIKIAQLQNRIMDAVLDALANNFLGTSTDLTIKYLAIGTSNVAITGAETKLGNEVFRTAQLNLYNYAVGSIRSEFIILDSDYTGTIQEIGIFCGPSATGTKDSGILLSRILWAYSKTATEELNFTRTDRVVL